MQRIMIIVAFCFATHFVSAQVVDKKHSFDATNYTQQHRPKIKKLESDNLFDNSLLSLGGGAMLFTNNRYYDSSPYYKVGYIASLRLVKFINYISGFGLNVNYQGGDYRLSGKIYEQSTVLSIGGDYLYTLYGRYSFEKPFKVYWATSLNAGFSDVSSTKRFIWGGNSGILCDYGLSSGVHFWGEVKVNVWSDQFDQLQSERKMDVMYSLQIGIGYLF